MPKLLRIDIRNKRLRGGRLAISADTTKPKERAAREAVLREVIRAGDFATIDRVRSGALSLAEVQGYYRRGELDRLEQESRTALEGAAAEVAAARPTVGEAVDAMVQTAWATRERGTAKVYDSVGEALKAAFGKATALDDVTPEQAQTWLTEPKTKGRPWSARSQTHFRMIARRVWKRGGATTDPWADIQLPRVRATRHAFLQPEEWRHVVGTVEGTPKAAALALACLAGLRMGEIVNLRTGIDVDLDACVIHIQPRQGKHAWKPKTDTSVASVPFKPQGELHRILAAHVASGFSGQRYFIIAAKRDRPLERQTLARWAKEAFLRVGLKYGRAGDGLTFHSLRHTYASWLAQRDVQLLKIARLMRDSVEVVSRFYAHLLPEDLNRPVEVIDDCARGE